MTDKYDVIVIGAGIGGLTCGAYLSKAGLRTLVVDKNSFLGGYCSVFKRGKFTFHAGPEGIIGLGKEGFVTHGLRELGVEKDIEFIRIEPLDRTYFCGMEIVTDTNMEEYIKSLQNYFPEEKDSIPNFFNVMTKMTKEITSPDFKPPKGILSMMKFARRFPTTAKHGRKTFKQLLDSFFKDQRLKFLLGFYPSNWFGIPPSKLIAPWAVVGMGLAYMEGLYYPKGGVQKFTDCIVDSLKKHGGELMPGKTVSKILVENGCAVGVQLQDGETLRGKYMVSNADVKQTFLKLVGEQYLKKEFTSHIRQLKQSVSGFVVYLGVDADLKNYDSHINYLGEDEGADWDNYHQTLQNGELELGGMGIRIPSNLEPSYAPTGKSSVILITLAPYSYKNNWMSGPERARTKQYQSLKKEVADKMVMMAEKVIPELSKHIIVQDAATPLTFERYTWNSEGAWYGLRIGQKMPAYVTPVKNLYLAGSNTRGPGVPNAFLSGIDTAKEILALEKL
ncbi:MAG: phytoene desaturase family protein [Candidatus Bathyarchaeia archaeon]|jgi:phytoene desaturase